MGVAVARMVEAVTSQLATLTNLLSPAHPDLHCVGHSLGASASKKFHPKVRNHGEGPY